MITEKLVNREKCKRGSFFGRNVYTIQIQSSSAQHWKPKIQYACTHDFMFAWVVLLEVAKPKGRGFMLIASVLEIYANLNNYLTGCVTGLIIKIYHKKNIFEIKGHTFYL